MKIRIKLEIYVLKEYLTATLCEKNVGEGLSKSSEMMLICGRSRSPKYQIITGYDHLQR